MDRNYRDENVLDHAREAFQATVALKLQHLRRFIRKGTNPALTGAYVECIVRSFVRAWLGSLRLCHGTFYSDQFEKSGQKPMQIDGIVWNPKAGPAVLQEDDFVIVHPVFCTSVIEIKTSITSLKDFQERLQAIYGQYMYCGTKPQIMGIVTADKDPEATSMLQVGDKTRWAYDYYNAGWCPIFILFKEDDNEFTPFEPAIEAMIRAIHTNQRSPGNYM